MYERFLRVVAESNRELPYEERVRVLGGSAPIPWTEVTEAKHLMPYLDRASTTASQVEDGIFEQKLRGLAIYGAGHCEKAGMGFPVELPDGRIDQIYTVRSLPTESRVSFESLGIDLGTPPSGIPIRTVSSRLQASRRDLLRGTQVHPNEVR